MFKLSSAVGPFGQNDKGNTISLVILSSQHPFAIFFFIFSRRQHIVNYIEYIVGRILALARKIFFSGYLGFLISELQCDPESDDKQSTTWRKNSQLFCLVNHGLSKMKKTKSKIRVCALLQIKLLEMFYCVPRQTVRLGFITAFPSWKLRLFCKNSVYIRFSAPYIFGHSGFVKAAKLVSFCQATFFCFS